MLRSRLTALLLAACLMGCGFQLRGTAGGPLPYRSLHLALPESADLSLWLARYVRASGQTTLARTPGEAEAVFQQLSDQRQKNILSVNAQGLVREYRLEARYTFRVVDPRGQELLPPAEITLIRDISYDDSSILAKDQEEAILWRDINRDLANQIMRRLTLVKPAPPRLPAED